MNRMPTSVQKRKGFTIVELVIVIAVIAILAAVLIPTFSGIVNSSNYSAAMQNATATMKSYNSYLIVQQNGATMPNGVVFENEGFYFMFLDGKLCQIDTASGAVSPAGSNPITDPLSAESEKLAADYAIYSLNQAAFDSIKSAVNAKSGSQWYYDDFADASVEIDGIVSPTDYVVRTVSDNRVYFSAIQSSDVDYGDGKTRIYAGCLLGSYSLGANEASIIIPEPTAIIKNIIFMIPDGAGFGSYDLANALKTVKGSGVSGQRTPITTNAISGMSVTGLYLDEFMIAHANTMMANGNGATDSAAAGTALLGGYKTNYVMVGVTPSMNPRANLIELCELVGKTTGVVTTKCLVDATPTAAIAHSLKRADQDESAYQKDISLQMLYSDIDLLLAYGTDGGYITKEGITLHDVRAGDLGYTVVTNLESLNNAANSGKTRVWSNISETSSAYYPSYIGRDYQAHHVYYDCDAPAGALTLLDMTKAAVRIMQNSNDPDGFCLMIEGGAIDNAAEGGFMKQTTAEYLAFDEAFAYCVNWAKGRDDTIVIACPDHDSGHFNKPADLTSVLNGLSDGTISSSERIGYSSGHSTQNVPVWLYAPDNIRTEILNNLGIPLDTSAAKIRNGNNPSDPLFANGTDGTGVLNSAYKINNSAIVHAVVDAAGLMSMDEATAKLFASAMPYGSYNAETEVFTFNNGATVKRNTDYYTLSGVQHPFGKGLAIYLTNPSVYAVNIASQPAFTIPNVFYVPRSALVELGYVTP